MEEETLAELPDAATAQVLADAIRAGSEGVLSQDVCSDDDPSKVLIPLGARIDLPNCIQRPRAKRARRDQLAAYVERLARPEANRQVRVFMWPLGSHLAPPILDDLGRAILGKQKLPDIARLWRPEALRQEDLVDRMLLLLWRALFRASSMKWTKQGVANLGPRRTQELARW